MLLNNIKCNFNLRCC